LCEEGVQLILCQVEADLANKQLQRRRQGTGCWELVS
jgi:hypothetical protein